MTPQNMWAVLDVVMELNIPFVGALLYHRRPIELKRYWHQILSHASPFAAIPDDVKEKVKAYGKGFLASWTPQQLVLDHPVRLSVPPSNPVLTQGF